MTTTERTSPEGHDVAGLKNIERLVGLVKKGDPRSLAVARRELNQTVEDIAGLVGVPAKLLVSWENGKAEPEHRYLIAWRLKMGDLVDAVIANYLNTDNPELVTQFWELLWRLGDINPK